MGPRAWKYWSPTVWKTLEELYANELMFRLAYRVSVSRRLMSTATSRLPSGDKNEDASRFEWPLDDWVRRNPGWT